MQAINIMQFREMPERRRQAVADWIIDHGFEGRGVIALNAIDDEYVEVTMHELNEDGSLKVVPDEEDGGVCVYHVVETVEIKSRPPWLSWQDPAAAGSN